MWRAGATLHRGARASLSRPLPLRSTGSRRAGSVAVAQGLSCSAACGILPDQGSNPCALHWQADSQPLRHQGSPCFCFLILFIYCLFIDLFILAAPDLSCGISVGSSSTTRDRTRAPCVGSAESYPLDHQGRPLLPCFTCDVASVMS